MKIIHKSRQNDGSPPTKV